MTTVKTRRVPWADGWEAFMEVAPDVIVIGRGKSKDESTRDLGAYVSRMELPDSELADWIEEMRMDCAEQSGTNLGDLYLRRLVWLAKQAAKPQP